MRNKIKIVFRIIFIALVITGLVSCFKDNDEEEELKIIGNFLKNNGIDTEPTASGLYYIELIEGTGVQPVAGDTVEIFYKGYFLTGSVFANNLYSDPYRFALGTGDVIPGLDEGVSYMTEGGEAMLVVPSSLAYGSVGSYYLGIPGYTPLAFEVILDKVVLGPYHY